MSPEPVDGGLQHIAVAIAAAVAAVFLAASERAAANDDEADQ